MWVVFEGLDKAGKTTLEWEFLKATNFKHVVVDRGPIGYMTFDKIFGRETKQGNHKFIHQARKCIRTKDFLIVYCYADKSIVDMRLKEYNETCPYDYNKAQELYADNIRKFYRHEKVVKLDTGVMSIDECVNKIVEKINELQKGE